MANPEIAEDDRIVAKCYVELGNVTKEQGEYEESLRYHRKSMEIFERIDDALSVADSHLNIAEVYKAKGELKQAMSEYEKGLTLYEDVYVEDGNNGIDGSMTSSFYDLQHTRSLSKSDETLPQTGLINVIKQDTPPSSSSSFSPRKSVNGVMNTSISSLHSIDSPTKKKNGIAGASQSITNVDDFAMTLLKKLTDEKSKSLSSSRTSDVPCLDNTDIFLPLPSSDPDYEMARKKGDSTERDAEALTQEQLLSTTNSSTVDDKSEEINKSNLSTELQENTKSNDKKQVKNTHRLWHYVLNKKLLIIVLTVFLTGTFVWLSSNNTPVKPVIKYSAKNIPKRESFRIRPQHNDLRDQLRRILTWRKTQIAALSKDNRRAIRQFLTLSSNIRNKMTVNRFQQIMDMLDLKLVLIPR